jgi:hypothetical protein
MSDFVPHLWVIGEREVGEPLALVAILDERNLRCVPLSKGIAKLPCELEVKLIGFIARLHFKRNSGAISCFGRIKHYVYCRSEKERWIVRPDGRIMNRNAGELRAGNYTLSLKSKPHQDIAFLFKARRSRD